LYWNGDYGDFAAIPPAHFHAEAVMSKEPGDPLGPVIDPVPVVEPVVITPPPPPPLVPTGGTLIDISLIGPMNVVIIKPRKTNTSKQFIIQINKSDVVRRDGKIIWRDGAAVV